MICSLMLQLALASRISVAEDANTEFFEKKIRPVLIEYCYECHAGSSKEIKGGLRLDSRETIRQGGDSGAGIVPGEPERSLIISAINYESSEMPPKGRLSAIILADFQKWITDGAVDPRDSETVTLSSNSKID